MPTQKAFININKKNPRKCEDFFNENFEKLTVLGF